MKSLVMYYSESGNTQKLAQAVAAGLGVPAWNLEDVSPEKAKDYDLICIGTPVQGGAPARRVLEFISKLPPVSGKKAAAFCTMHLFGDKRVFRVLKDLLECRGMIFLGGVSAKGLSRLIANFGPRIFNRGRPNQDELSNAENFGRNLLAMMGKPS